MSGPALLLLAVAVAWAGEAARPTAAVVVVMDGARWSETWGDPRRELVPHLATDLAPAGVVMTRFENRGPTVTNPGHAAIASGIYHRRLDNDGSGALEGPSFLQAWLAADAARPASAAWIITGKPKLAMLADCALAEWRERAKPSVDCGVVVDGKAKMRSDTATIDAALAILKRERPRVLLINLADVDARGHSGDVPAYRSAIRVADAQILRLWRFITEDPAYAGQTLFVLTNDHGRHANDAPAARGKVAIKDHGCDCEGCRHLLCFAAGPGLRKGVEDPTPAEQIDLAPSIAAALGLALPTAKGRVMKEWWPDQATGP